MDATTSVDGDGLEAALQALLDASASHLDAPALTELREMIRVLASSV